LDATTGSSNLSFVIALYNFANERLTFIRAPGKDEALPSSNIGPLVLAGSGEFTDTMDIVDRYVVDLIDGRPVVLIATSCAMEGDERMTWWERLGVAHFKRIGVDALPLRIATREDADSEEKAAQIREAGFVWFSGGSAIYLARCFDGTRAFDALRTANERGAAIAGASGGLGVLNPHVSGQEPPRPAGPPNPIGGANDPRSSVYGRQVVGFGPPAYPPDAPKMPETGPSGLGLAAPVRAMAHFDRMEARRPEAVERTVASLEPGQKAVGVDEDTAVVWTEGAWKVMGHKRVQVFEKDRAPVLFRHGDTVDVLPPPERATLAVK
jgi:cyanophycinase-like exopeptidase